MCTCPRLITRGYQGFRPFFQMYTGNTAYKVGTETEASDFKIELRFSHLVLGDLPGMHPKIAIYIIYVSEKEESEC